MGRKAEREEKGPPSVDPEAEEKKRLRSLAVSKKILRRSPANASAPLEPSKAVVKLQGRDIVKRGQRKSRYLFSFPGLIAPLSGGKVGELANLSTKNPVLYLEFPQGRLKLFGTHVYPKNKYLTLQLSKSAKGVMCEDVFESLIVFSEARWIGLKDENPEENQLEFPKDLNEEKDSDYDFKGGAGITYEEASGGQKFVKEYFEPSSPENEFQYADSDDNCPVKGKDDKKTIETTPIRQSARMSGKTSKVTYVESSSGDDSIASDSEAVGLDELSIKVEGVTKAKSPSLINEDDSSILATPVFPPEKEEVVTKENLKHSPLKSTRKSPNKKGPLVQASLSTLFEKVAEKKTERAADDSSGTKGPGNKRQRPLAKEKAEPVQVKASTRNGNKFSGKSGARPKTAAMRKQSQEEDDWNEDISSDSQEEDEDEDEDWVA
ncbi:DNA-binding protein RHL1 [Platanthera zijinensis]|uniref:DNA-binding protein RHL1 n=1 Tax=Platanthera zijinensis TaxID=2320716 RepID=A0AAP0FX95_9ASPA